MKRENYDAAAHALHSFVTDSFSFVKLLKNDWWAVSLLKNIESVPGKPFLKSRPPQPPPPPPPSTSIHPNLNYTSRGDRPPDFENCSVGPDERNSSLTTFSRNRNKFATVTYSEPERLCFMRTIKGTVPVKARKEASKHFFLLSNKWQNCQC